LAHRTLRRPGPHRRGLAGCRSQKPICHPATRRAQVSQRCFGIFSEAQTSPHRMELSVQASGAVVAHSDRESKIAVAPGPRRSIPRFAALLLDAGSLQHGGFLCWRAEPRRRREAFGTGPSGHRKNRKPKCPVHGGTEHEASEGGYTVSWPRRLGNDCPLFQARVSQTIGRPRAIGAERPCPSFWTCSVGAEAPVRESS
jgi:hypothetical protein